MTDHRALDDALEVLLRRHTIRLRSAIEHHCRRSATLDADDIAQEVRIRLWRALQRDRNAVFSASYLQRTVLSVVVDAVRRTPPKAESVDDFDSSGHAAWPDGLVSREGPEIDAQSDAVTRALNAALAELPRQRRLAVAFTLQGFAAKECGELMGISSEAARKLAERGLALVRENLRQRGFGEFDD
ncbi:MAG: sigma-70 family RNA polymerase sigma factor [Lysobacterales bacterium]